MTVWWAWWLGVAAVTALWGCGYLVQSDRPVDRVERFMPPLWVLPAAFGVSAVLLGLRR